SDPDRPARFQVFEQCERRDWLPTPRKQRRRQLHIDPLGDPRRHDWRDRHGERDIGGSIPVSSRRNSRGRLQRRLLRAGGVQRFRRRPERYLIPYLRDPQFKAAKDDLAERKAWFKALNDEARLNDAWITSTPGAKEVIIETL